MNRLVRSRLTTGRAVRGFCSAHPSADANHAVVLDRLNNGILRLEVLAQQQEGGYRASRTATVRRRALRRRLQYELLRHLVTVAEVAAAAERPELAEQFYLPPLHGTNEAFRTVARKLLEQGRAERELLVRYGLSDRLLDDVAAALDEFDASVAASSQARQDHVGARAELKAVSDELMREVELLDGLNRYRFSGDAELLAAWESARNVVAGPRTAAGEEAPPTGEVKPAA